MLRTALKKGKLATRYLNAMLRTALINRKLQANVTVINEEEQTSIQFYCLPSIFIERICQIACRLFHLNPRFYH
jgi:hypothetical protein